MHPTLFTIGPLTVHSFGLMVALGFLAAYGAMARLSRGGWCPGVGEENVSRIPVLAMVGGAVGARLAYVCEHWTQEFADAPVWDILRFDKGGLMFYGGLIGAILVVALYFRARKVPLLQVLDLCAATLPLGHAFGRVGCFLNGCCFGKVCDGPLSVTYPAHSPAWWEQVGAGLIGRGAPESLPILPVQLFEAAANFVLFAVLYRLARRNPPSGFVSGVYLVAYAVIRFVTETMRSDPRMTVFSLSIGQFIGIPVFAAGVALLVLSRKRRRGDA
jgi:phosphatidylglycerol:prolipoprotein diacylglycerol transferase